MPVPTYICRNRHGAYCFRVVIPEILRRHFPNNQREIWRSLKTHRRQDAIRLARVYAVASDNLFQGLREGIVPKNKPAFHDIRQMLIGADGSIKLEGISFNPDNPEADKLLLDSVIESATESSLKLRGAVITGESSSPLLSEAIRSFCEEQKRSKAWTPKTAGETRAVHELFLRIVGDVPVASLKHEQLTGYKNTLLKLPAKVNQAPEYRGKSIEEIIASSPAQSLAVTTINKWLVRVGAFLKWAVRQGYTDKNYAEGLSLKAGKSASDEREAFNGDDLVKLFSTPIFTDNKWDKPYRYWMPLIGLYTGARIEEICQLHLEDIREEDGIYLFDINDDSQDKGLKTESSRRIIPVHSSLIKLGLIGYVTGLRCKGETRLFPELVLSRDGYSQSASKWFGRYIRKQGIENRKKVFHSFRHTVADQFKQKSVPLEQAESILGHKSQSMSYGRYGKAYLGEVLKPVIEQLAYPIESLVEPFSI